MERQNRNSAHLLGLAHFFVDFACTALLTGVTDTLPFWQVTACAVLYNGLAFAFQLPVGALGDCLKLQRGLAAMGCLLVAAGAFLPWPLAVCAVIGLGNACFHVGGGRETLKRGGKAASMAGRFVAPGAVGIFLGPRLAGIRWLVRLLLPACLAVFAAVLFLTRAEGEEAEDEKLKPIPMGRARRAVVCVCMFLTVLLRSYMGTVLQYPILSEFGWALMYTLCIFGGKYFGGILADRFGTVRFCGVAQAMATALFMLSVRFPVLAMPAIFLFNTTMAVTVSRLYACVPGYPGTMFGLTTFALYLGVLPRLLGLQAEWFHGWGLGLLSFLSAVLLAAGLILSEGGGRCGRRDHKITVSVTGTDTGI